eukprot:1136313-Pelagomonas_calceolata.AAC.5
MSMKRGMRERKLLAESALYFAYKQEIRGNSGGPVFNAAGECCGIAFQGNAVASCSRFDLKSFKAAPWVAIVLE